MDEKSQKRGGKTDAPLRFLVNKNNWEFWLRAHRQLRIADEDTRGETSRGNTGSQEN
jgi:hypothetical protein